MIANLFLIYSGHPFLYEKWPVWKKKIHFTIKMQFYRKYNIGHSFYQPPGTIVTPKTCFRVIQTRISTYSLNLCHFNICFKLSLFEGKPKAQDLYYHISISVYPMILSNKNIYVRPFLAKVGWPKESTFIIPHSPAVSSEVCDYNSKDPPKPKSLPILQNAGTMFCFQTKSILTYT